MANDHSTGNPRPAKTPTERRLTVGTQYYEYPAHVPEQRRSRRVPWLQMRGDWLAGLRRVPHPGPGARARHAWVPGVDG